MRRPVPSRLTFAFCLMAAALCRASSAKAALPNVVIVLADDQGWGDLSVHGNTNLHTPNIDSLAASGALFERFFVCPVCSPTRAEFLTGRYHPRGGVFSTSTGGERLDLDEMTIAQTFKAAGYRTAAFGKWHNGMQYPYHPNARGFEEYYGFCSGHWGHYFSPVLEYNGQTVRGKGYVTDDFTNHALQFIEQNQEQPFFCYLPYCIPHSPMQVPDEFYQKVRRPGPGKTPPRTQERRCPQNAGGPGDVRKHRLERRPDFEKARRPQTGREHDRDLFQRQRPQQLAVERRHERPERLDR